MSIITDEDIYLYACCPTKLYNNRFNLISEENESLYIAYTHEMIDEYRKKISSKISPIIVDSNKNRNSETNKLMKKGENNIQGSIVVTNELQAELFILEKIEKSSRLGKHSYQVIDFIQSIQFVEEYKKKLACQINLATTAGQRPAGMLASLGSLDLHCKTC